MPDTHKWHYTCCCERCGATLTDYKKSDVQCRDDVVAVTHLLAEQAGERLMSKILEHAKAINRGDE